jgi:sialic acid synthase SpsE
MAYTLCDLAKEAGASAAKFQTWVTDKILPPDHPRYQMLKDLEMPFDFFRNVKQYCDDIGIMFLSTPDDEESLDFLVDEMDIEIIKIGSGNLTNKSFLEKVATKNKPIILSTGMGSKKEIREALDLLCRPGVRWVQLLHCISLYPTKYEEVNLNAIKQMKDEFTWYTGLSDHTPGIEIPIAAVALGATVIEKHLTLNRNLPGPDHAASLEPGEFKQMVQAIRNVEAAMGNGIKQPCERELQVRDLYRLKGV